MPIPRQSKELFEEKVDPPMIRGLFCAVLKQGRRNTALPVPIWC
jgi:hypothetical protein